MNETSFSPGATSNKCFLSIRFINCLFALLTWAMIAAAHAQCPFSVSGTALASAERDGLLLLRVARGVADSALTQGTATTQSATQIRSFVSANKDKLDVDGDGVFSLADAMIISRHLKGFKGDALLDGVTPPALAKGSARLTGQAIAQYIADDCATAPLQTVNRPNAFVFNDVHDADTGSTQTSNTVTISGLSAPAPIRVVDGEYSIGCTANFTNAASTIANDQTVCVRNTASSEEGASINTSLWIGTAQGTFVSTTRYANPPGLQPIPTTTVTQGNYPPPVLTGDLAPTIIAAANGVWNSASTWNLGRVPVDGDIVSIPKNIAVNLTGNTARLAGLWIMGSLDFDRTTVGLVSRYVFVYGRLQAGTPAQPFAQSATFEFTGSDKAHTVMAMGTKGLVVMEGGLLSLHGERRLSWTKIAANPTSGVTSLPVGTTSMTLIDSPASWRVGDKLLIAATEIDPRTSEVVTITGISGNTVNFTPGLVHAKHAVLQTINGKRLDQRPSVSLLTRNIVMRGDAGSDASKFSGHVMIMANGHAQVSGVQFDRMGQLGVKGRYPIHWHIAGDRVGNYVINSSISTSHQRAYVVHSTNNVLVEGNVAYEVINHAYVWSEDGDEHSNRFIRNVGVLVTSPDEANFIFPINNSFFNNNSQAEHRSAVYWGRSFDRHVIRGNIAGGTIEAFGYFFDLFTPRAFSTNEGSALVFENNIAHSNYKVLATGNQINYPEATAGHALMVTTGTSGNAEHVFRNYTGYYNTSAAWFEDRTTTLKNSIVADNGIGAILLRGVIDGVTLVGKSASPVSIAKVKASVSIGSPSLLHIAGSNHGGKRAPIVRDATVMNHDGVGVLWDVDNVSPLATLENVRFENVNDRLEILAPFHFEYPNGPMWGWNDRAGSINGDHIPARHVVRDSNLINARCLENSNHSSYACPSSDSMLLRSNRELTLIDSRGKIAFAKNIDDDYFDPGMPKSGAISWIATDERYELIGNASVAFSLQLSDAAGKTVEFSVESSNPSAGVTRNLQTVPLASSLFDMRQSPDSARFYDAVAKRLFTRIVVPTSDTSDQTISFTGTFPARTTPLTGLAPVAVPSNLADGFVRTRHNNTAARYSQRYSDPMTLPTNTFVSNANAIDRGASDTALDATPLRATNVIRAYVFAPVDGIYRLHLWGDGGGTSVYINGRYIQGEGWGFYNSNFFVNNVPSAAVIPFLHPSDRVSLKAGWHEVTLIHAKFDPSPSQIRTESSLLFRWATPSAPDTWVFPSVKRAQ
jgi:G8 domain